MTRPDRVKNMLHHSIIHLAILMGLMTITRLMTMTKAVVIGTGRHIAVETESTSQSTASSTITGNSSTTPFDALPDGFLRQMWETHGFKDTRTLPLLSKGVAAAIDQSSLIRWQYHTRTPFTSLLVCMRRRSLSQLTACARYWTNQIPSLTLSCTQKFTLLVASSSQLSSRISSRNSALTEFKLAIYRICSPALKSALYHLMSLDVLRVNIDLIDGALQFYMQWSYNMNSIKASFSSVIQELIILMNYESLHLNASVSRGDTLVLLNQTRNIKRTLHQVEKWNARLINNSGYQAEFAALRNIRTLILQSIFLRFSSYLIYVNHVSSHMLEIDDLDHVAEDNLDDILVPYPPTDFPISSLPIARVMDQILFPALSMKLYRSIIQHRRLDLLTQLVEEEGMLFLHTLTRPAPTDGEAVSRSHGYLASLNEDLGDEGHILHFMVVELALTPQAATHGSWNTLSAFELILENGGLHSLYPRFLADAVLLKNLELMHYLVVILGITEGMNEAVAEAKRLRFTPMIRFLNSHYSVQS